MSRRYRRRKNNNVFNFFIMLFLLFLIGLLIYKIANPEKIKGNSSDNKINSTESNKKNEQKKEEETNNTKKDSKILEEKANEVTEKSSKNEITETKNEQKRRGGAVTLELIGEENIEIAKGSKYKDEGVKATYSDGADASNEVDVDNAVDTSKEGTYTVAYYAGNVVVIRRVTVK